MSAEKDAEHVKKVVSILNGDTEKPKVIDQVSINLTRKQVRKAIADAAFKKLGLDKETHVFGWTQMQNDGGAVVKVLRFDRELDTDAVVEAFKEVEW